jgi:transposase
VQKPLGQYSASVSRLARECGVNANQVSRWLREHGHGVRRARKAGGGVVRVPTTFVAVSMPPALPIRAASGHDIGAGTVTGTVMDMQARLPNGVAIDLRGVELRNVGDVIEALGRLRCSASMKA